MAKQDSRSARLTRREATTLLLGAGAGFGLVTALGERVGAAAAWQAGATSANRVTFPQGAIIRTVLKDVSPETLGKGATMFHEHLSLSSPYPYRPPPKEPVPPHWTENIDLVVEEVKGAVKDGVSCIVSGGTRDLGQKPANLRKLGEQVAAAGVYIVVSGGLHTQPNYPPDVPNKTEDQIVADFLREAAAERWGAIGEIGTSRPMHPDERKVLRASGKVHLRTGLPLFTHTPHDGCPDCAVDQLDTLESLGVNLRLICIGHLADIRNDPKAETQKAIAKRGAFLGFDTVGRPERLAEHVEMVKAVVDAGYEDHVLFSSDAAGVKDLKRNGGVGGFSRVMMVFVPKLREAGVKEATIHKMLVDNPRRFLAFVPKRSS